MQQSNYPLAMAYVFPQDFKDLYEPEIGYKQGTMFTQLDKPFTGKPEVLR